MAELDEHVAALASEFGGIRHRTGELVDPRRRQPTRSGRARALLPGQGSYATGARRGGEGLRWSEHEKRGRGRVLALELERQEAAISLWLEQRTAKGGKPPRTTDPARSAANGHGGGLGALDGRTRQAFINALRVEHEAACRWTTPRRCSRPPKSGRLRCEGSTKSRT